MIKDRDKQQAVVYFLRILISMPLCMIGHITQHYPYALHLYFQSLPHWYGNPSLTCI